MNLDGKLEASSKASARTKALLSSLEVTGIEKSATETVVTIKPSSAPRGPMQVFVTAIRVDDTKVQPLDPTDNKRHVFKVPAAEFDAFQINLRSMTDRVVCENVAWLPGQKTEAKIKVEAITADNDLAQPGKEKTSGGPPELRTLRKPGCCCRIIGW